MYKIDERLTELRKSNATIYHCIQMFVAGRCNLELALTEAVVILAKENKEMFDRLLKAEMNKTTTFLDRI